MAGSYRHVTNADGSFRGTDLLDNLGDAYEALEEMHAMIEWLADRYFEGGYGPTSRREAIHLAWLEGYAKTHYPPENVANESICGFNAFWDEETA